jgi:hypothetical protein
MTPMFPMAVAPVHAGHVSVIHVHVRRHCRTAIAVLTPDKAAETQQS